MKSANKLYLVDNKGYHIIRKIESLLGNHLFHDQSAELNQVGVFDLKKAMGSLWSYYDHLKASGKTKEANDLKARGVQLTLRAYKHPDYFSESTAINEIDC